MKKGFTLVELMIVISVMAVLATIALYGYSQIANNVRADTDMLAIMKAARMARVQQDKVLGLITSYCSSCSCYPAQGGDGWSSASCKTTMDAMFPKIGITSGAMKDPWGCYYTMDENELEGSSSNCTPDYFFYHCGTQSKTIPMYSSQCNGNP